MAPFSKYMMSTMSQFELRSLGVNNSTIVAPAFTPSQGNTLQCLALAFSTVSVASAILAFYWFMKMRRSFRHDLVMLLIQSDMFKALWFMIYPIVTFTHGPVPNSSKFCQVNGFFIALGTEASDVAVLMIAIHSALYIFRPRVSVGEGGLYPYRNIAYTIWVIYPIIMASLAFINNRNAYVSEGTYCYLPVRPFWYRLALGWIPRYIIFIFILGIYASIYYYVRYKFTGFTKASRDHSSGSNDDSGDHENGTVTRKLPKRPTVPPTPVLHSYNFIFGSRRPSVVENEGPKYPASPIDLRNPMQLSTPASAHRFIWANLISSSDRGHSDTPSSEVSAADTDSFSGPSTPQPLPLHPVSLPSSPHAQGSLESDTPSRSRDTSWQDDFVHRISLTSERSPVSRPPTGKRSMVDIFTVLRHRPGDTEVHTPVSQLELVNSRGQNLAVSEMLRTREKIRRQLRFLFIYPLVYIGMWIVPFVSHVLQYDDKFARSPPFGLTCVTTICICSQAAVDCWLFSTREKPWRHIPGNDGKFFASLKFWSGWKGWSKRRVASGPGKTREEMTREARVAYRRRDQELAERRNELGQNMQNGEPKRKERDWWEGAGLDGSPPALEIPNPLDHIIVTEASTPDETASSDQVPESAHLKPTDNQGPREKKKVRHGVHFEDGSST